MSKYTESLYTNNTMSEEKYINPDYHVFNIGDLVRAKNWMTGSPGLVVSASCYGHPGPDMLKIPQYAVRWDFGNEHIFLPFDLEVWPHER